MYGVAEPLLLLLSEWLLLKLAWEGVNIYVDVHVAVFLSLVAFFVWFFFLLLVLVWLEVFLASWLGLEA